MSDKPQTVSIECKPYRIWPEVAPFDKHGWPVMGNFGRSTRSVVVMENATFQRLIAEHPSLATAQFEVGERE